MRDGLNWYTYCGNNPVKFNDPTGYEPEDKYVLSKLDYIRVLFLQVVFYEAEKHKNLKVMAGAAKQAAAVRQKPEYNGKFANSDENGVYKQQYVPEVSLEDYDDGGVFIDVLIFETQTDVDIATGMFFTDSGDATTGYPGYELFGFATSVLSFFIDKDYVKGAEVGGDRIAVKIYDIYTPENQYVPVNYEGLFLINRNYVNTYKKIEYVRKPMNEVK